MDNKVILSVGVFLGVLVAVGGWMLTSSSDNPTMASATDAADADGTVDRREKILGGKRLIKRQNTEQILRSVTPEGVKLEERVGDEMLTTQDGGEPGEAATYGLDEESVKAALDERMVDLQACYQTALFHTPELAGDMVLSLTLEPVPEQTWASVATVASDSDLDAPVFEGCITTVFEELRFEASEPTTLTWPVQFTAEGKSEGDEADPAE